MTYWTNKEESRLKQLVELGKSDAEIAQIMGRSKTAIMHKRKYGLGIDRRVRWTAQEDARLKRLLTTTDKSLEQIGKLLNREPGAVERRKERLGLKRIPVKIEKNNPACIAQLVKFKMAGWTHERIAEVFEVHPTYISNLLIVNGYKRFCDMRFSRKKKCKRPIWTELEIHLLRKALKREYSFEQMCMELPRRSKHAIREKCRQITRYWLSADVTRYWLSADEKEERKRLQENHRKWRVY